MKQLNVLILIMDDQRADTIATLGNPHIRTPNLDRLVKEGTSQRAYTTVPVCTPARAELLTGANAYANGCRWFNEPIRSEFVLLPRAFQSVGYQTCHVGKWHNNGHPRDTDKGYDDVRCVFPDDVVGGYLGRGYRNAHAVVYQEAGRTLTGHSTEVLAREAMRFIDSASPARPWFCYLALHSPHDPRVSPEPFMSMYDPDRLPLPDNFMPEHPFDNGDMLIRDERLEEFPRRPDRIRRHLADYYAMVTHHDYWIGQILQVLEQRDQLNNTLIVFTSDHGLAIGSHGLMGKENLYEHSQSVPLILRGPGVPIGRRSDLLTTHYDLYPTLCELTGVPVPGSVQGHSYAAALASERSFRETVCCSYRDCMRSIRDERWKLIWYPTTGESQLFDLLHDPSECSNLLASWRSRLAGAVPEHSAGQAWLTRAWPQRELKPADFRQIAQALQARLHEWMERNGDPVYEKIQTTAVGAPQAGVSTGANHG